MNSRSPHTTATSLRRLPALLLIVLAALAVSLSGGSPANAADAPTVTGVEVTSDAGDDDTYALGETITITVTFSEAVDVTGTPQLKIDMDPADWGTKVVDYASGSGTASLVFTHEVVEPNYSTQGIAVLENSLDLNGGTIRSASSQTNASLSHTGKDHDPEHKVDWTQSPPAPTPTPTPSPTPTPTPSPAPSVTGVQVTSDAGDDDTYALGETITIAVAFSEAVDVTGTPQLKIDMDPADWGTKVVDYAGGSGTASLTFDHEVVEPNLSRQGIAVLADSLALNGGTIRSASHQTDAGLSHTGRGHDADHKVDWRLGAPAPTPGPTDLRVTISASPASPEVNQYATLSATIYNIPFDSGRPTYDWQIQRDGGWNSVWNGPTFSYSTNSPTSIAFRLTVSYESGIADTSEPLTVTWTGACELAPPEDVSALGVARAAVAFWEAPSDDDACEPVGYLVGARGLDGGEWIVETARPEARSHVLDGLTPGQVEYHVTTIYPTGVSDRPVALPQVTVPFNCALTLTVEADVDSGISGVWTNVAGAPSGCVFGPEIEFQFKQSTWDHFRNYGRYPNSQQTGQGEDSFIAYGLRPGVSYDFRIVAVDAAGRTNRSNVASATVVYDVDATVDEHSPRNVRVVPHNRGNAYVTWEDSASAPSGQTTTKFVVEWKTPGGTAMTKDVDVAAPKETEITGLTDGTSYLVRVAVQRTDASNTIYHAWSGPAPITARSEPLQVWFESRTPRNVGSRLFAYVTYNRPAALTICHFTIDGTPGTLNCPRATLVHREFGGRVVSIHARSSTEDGSVADSSVSVGEFGSPHPVPAYASGGNGTLVVVWEDPDSAGLGGIGTHDAWVVQHRKQNEDEEGTWPAWPSGHVITDTSARSHTFTGLADGTWQVRVRGRNANTEDHDDDPMTPEQTVHRLGFTSPIQTVTVNSTYTAVPGTPAGVVITPGWRPINDDDKEAPGVGTLVVEWEPYTGDGSEVYAYQLRHRRGDYAFGDGGGSWTQGPEIYPRQVERICRVEDVETEGGLAPCINPRSYVIPNLIGGRDYDVAIRAKNANGWGAWLPVGEFNLPNGFPPLLQSATVNGITLRLTFDRSLDIDSRPSTSVFSVSADGSGQTPTGIGISGNTVTLTLGTAVTSGQTVTVTYVRPPQTPLQHNDAQGPSFSSFSVTNNTP